MICVFKVARSHTASTCVLSSIYRGTGSTRLKALQQLHAELVTKRDHYKQFAAEYRHNLDGVLAEFDTRIQKCKE